MGLSAGAVQRDCFGYIPYTYILKRAFRNRSSTQPTPNAAAAAAAAASKLCNSSGDGAGREDEDEDGMKCDSDGETFPRERGRVGVVVQWEYR